MKLPNLRTISECITGTLIKEAVGFWTFSGSVQGYCNDASKPGTLGEEIDTPIIGHLRTKITSNFETKNLLKIYLIIL